MHVPVLKEFLACLGIHSLETGADGWQRCSCPLAPWTHEKGTDSNPSFGVQATKTGKSFCHCFSCGFSGEPYKLVTQMRQSCTPEELGDYDFGQAFTIALAEEDEALLATSSLNDYGHTDQIEDVDFPEYWLDSFPPFTVSEKAIMYLLDREVPIRVGKLLDLRWDETRERICFPVRDWDGALRGLHGRSVVGQEPKYLIYRYKQKSNLHVWYGENTLDVNNPVVITESVFDYARIYQVYRNVTCPLSANFSIEKANRLGKCFQILSMFDNDKAGDEGHAKVMQALGKSNMVKRLYLPKNIKDPGELTVYQARDLLSPHVTLDEILLTTAL